MATGVSGRAKGGQAKRPASGSATTSRSAKKRKGDSTPKKGKRRSYDTAELVQSRERDVEDDDVDAFDEYKHFHGFLSTLDPSALAKRVKRQPRVPQSAPASASITAVRTASKPVPPTSDSSAEESEDDGDGEVSDISIEPMDDLVSSDFESIDEVDGDSISEEESEPADYETISRSFKNQPDSSDRLPVKSRDGRVHLLSTSTSAPTVSTTPMPPSVVDALETSEDDDDQASDAHATVTPSQKLNATKEKLARVASAVIEDPEENINSLAKLREVMSAGSVKEQQFALLTMAAVYKDIIPGYRIRPLTDVEKAEKATKEVKKTRAFEQDLVNGYQQFVNALMSFCKTSRRQATTGEVHPLKRVAVTAACSLLSSAPHFNFRTELFSILVSQICKKTTDEVFMRSLSTLSDLFASDEDGEASFEAIRLLTKRMKEREYQVDNSVISSFLQLRLLTELDVRASASAVDRKAKQKRAFINKKNKKLLKAQKEVEKDMREAEATVDADTRERLQSETLKLVFATYFRILQTGNRSVMGAALEGLARFAHLINVDFFGDLLEVLKQLLGEVNEQSERMLSSRAALLCIVTAFAIQTGQDGTKETITLDLSQFLQALYAAMIDLTFDCEIEQAVQESQFTNASQRSTINVATEAEMLVRALDAVFFKQRSQATQTRLSAFVKRLALCAANFPEKPAAASLELTKRLAARYSRLVSLFNTDETAADGRYDGATNALELTNTATTSAYEMALFQKHYSPRVRKAAASLLETLRESASNVRH